MPIDPRIIGQIETPKINTPFESLNLVMEAQQREAVVRDAQRKERAAARAEQESAQVRAILEQTGGDWEQALPQIRRVAPGVSLDIEKALGEERKKRADAIKVELDNEASLTDKWLGRLRGLPEGDDELYQMYRQAITREMPDLGAQLPPRYDRDRLTQVQQIGLTAKEHADLQRQALEFAAKGEWRQSTGAALATATSPEEWQEILTGQKELGAPAAVLRQFGPWSPDAPQRARQMGMTADQQAQSADRAADNTRQAANDAEARRHNRVVEGISAGQLGVARQNAADQPLVSIIGPDGKPVLVRRAEAVGKTPAPGSGEGSGGVKLSAGQQQEFETLLTVSDMANEVITLGDAIGWKGVGALGAGTLSELGSKLGAGTDKERSLRNKISNIQATIAKLRGGTSFTVNEQRLLDRYTPSINKSDAENAQALRDLQAFVETKRKNMIKIASGDLSPNTPAETAPPAQGGRIGPYTYKVKP